MKPLTVVAFLICSAINCAGLDSLRFYRNYTTSFMLRQGKSLKLLEESEKNIKNLFDVDLKELDSLVIPLAVIDISSQKVPETLIALQAKLLNDVFFHGNRLGMASRPYVGFVSESFNRAVIFNIDSLKSSVQYAMNFSRTYGKRGYLNIFIYEGTNDEAGFALPCEEFPNSCAIFINRLYWMGSNPGNYNQGKTLVHLIGNYFGLPPLWGYEACGDDGINDTPIHNAPNYGCPNDKTHISTCSFGKKELVHNFMDNSDDDCLDNFTKEQLNFLHHSMAVWQQLNLASMEGSSKANLTLNTYPNPASDHFDVEFRNSINELSKSYNLEVINSIGVVLFSESFIGNTFNCTIPCINWPGGMYNVIVYSDNTVKTNHILIVK